MKDKNSENQAISDALKAKIAANIARINASKNEKEVKNIVKAVRKQSTVTVKPSLTRMNKFGEFKLIFNVTLKEINFEEFSEKTIEVPGKVAE